MDVQQCGKRVCTRTKDQHQSPNSQSSQLLSLRHGQKFTVRGERVCAASQPAIEKKCVEKIEKKKKNPALQTGLQAVLQGVGEASHKSLVSKRLG